MKESKKVNTKATYIAFLLTAVFMLSAIAVGYAWFSTILESTGNSSVIISASELGTITFRNGDTIDVNNVLPGWCDAKRINVEATGLTVLTDYIVNLNIVENELVTLGETLGYMQVRAVYIEDESTVTDGEIGSLSATDITETSGTKQLLTGKLGPNEIHTYDIVFCFPDLNEAQNSQEGKQFSAYLTFEIDPSTYGTYAIALDKQNGSGGISTIYEKYDTGYFTNSEITTQMTTSSNAITVPTRECYQFEGYYTQPNGNGKKFIDETGKLTTNANATTRSCC